MWLELDGTWFNTDTVAVVRAAGLGKDKTAAIIYTIGQNVMDGGFLVNVPVAGVVEQLREARFLEIVERLDAEQDAEEQLEEELQIARDEEASDVIEPPLDHAPRY